MAHTINPTATDQCVFLTYEDELAPLEVIAARHEVKEFLTLAGGNRVVINVAALPAASATAARQRLAGRQSTSFGKRMDPRMLSALALPSSRVGFHSMLRSQPRASTMRFPNHFQADLLEDQNYESTNDKNKYRKTGSRPPRQPAAAHTRTSRKAGARDFHGARLQTRSRIGGLAPGGERTENLQMNRGVFADSVVRKSPSEDSGPPK